MLVKTRADQDHFLMVAITICFFLHAPRVPTVQRDRCVWVTAAAARAATGAGSSAWEKERQTVLEEHSISYALIALSASYFSVLAAGFLGHGGGFQRIPVLALRGSIASQQAQPPPAPHSGQRLFSARRVPGALRLRDVTWRLLEITQLGSISAVTCRNIGVLSPRFQLQEVYHRPLQTCFPTDSTQPSGVSFLEHVC